MNKRRLSGALAPAADESKATAAGSWRAYTATNSGSLPTNRVIRKRHGDGVAYATINLGSSTYVALVVTPRVFGSIEEQLAESLAIIESVLKKQHGLHVLVSQTVFLKNPENRSICERLLAARYGRQLPVTTFVFQPPSGGASMAIEALSTGGESVRIERPHPQVLAVHHDGLRWIYCGLPPRPAAQDIYKSVINGFGDMEECLAVAGSAFDLIIRLWLYLGNITGPTSGLERYMELNRARTDFYLRIPFGRRLGVGGRERIAFPATTCIGACGSNLAMSSLALNTSRKDVFLLPLENPRQTPSYHYPLVYSPESPKFVRGMAVVIGREVVTWLSGTASILNSESQHINDIRKQTEQAINNIEQLIAPSNFEAHGLRGAGAKLADIAQLRVHMKRPQDYLICRDICTQRFGKTPIIYTTADVCRSNLLVEMEGVVFSRRALED